MENQLDNIFSLSFDEDTRNQLQTITLWAKISAICAFVGYGIAIIVAFLDKTTSTSFSLNNEGAMVNSFARGGMIAGALISAIIGTAINYFLYRFAVETKRGLSMVDPVKLNLGLASLKTYFKILGIILVICLILVALVILFALLAQLVSPH
ncbi:MAG TPA: hypothetical protein VMT76_17220 [Puia sp.]|nr:hypothetical protein [Puia sp.]